MIFYFALCRPRAQDGSRPATGRMYTVNGVGNPPTSVVWGPLRRMEAAMAAPRFIMVCSNVNCDARVLTASYCSAACCAQAAESVSEAMSRTARLLELRAPGWSFPSLDRHL